MSPSETLQICNYIGILCWKVEVVKKNGTMSSFYDRQIFWKTVLLVFSTWATQRNTSQTLRKQKLFTSLLWLTWLPESSFLLEISNRNSITEEAGGHGYIHHKLFKYYILIPRLLLVTKSPLYILQDCKTCDMQLLPTDLAHP